MDSLYPTNVQLCVVTNKDGQLVNAKGNPVAAGGAKKTW